MTDIATWVVAAGTVALALATAALVWATRSLVIETRTQRHAQREAEVGVTVQPWEEAHMYLAVTITNFGPANARDLSFDIRLMEPDGNVRDEWSLREPLFPTRRQRTTLVTDIDIDGLIAACLSVALDWSWTNGNGDQLKEQQVLSVEQFVAGLRGSGALLQRNYLREVPKIRTALEKIERSLAKVAQRAERDE